MFFFHGMATWYRPSRTLRTSGCCPKQFCPKLPQNRFVFVDGFYFPESTQSKINFLQLCLSMNAIGMDKVCLYTVPDLAVRISDTCPTERCMSCNWVFWKSLDVFVGVMKVETIYTNQNINNRMSGTLFWKCNSLEMFPLVRFFSPIDNAQVSCNSELGLLLEHWFSW